MQCLKSEGKCPICKIAVSAESVIASPQIDDILTAYRELALPTGEIYTVLSVNPCDL